MRDNDASGIYGYSLAGAQYGYAMLWVLVLVTISLGVCQEMCARMGAVTGKGLADLIREEYGVKVTLFAMAALLIANYATTVSEFAGITAAVEIFARAERPLDRRAARRGRRLAAGDAGQLQARGAHPALRLPDLSGLHRLPRFWRIRTGADVLHETVLPDQGYPHIDNAYIFVVINVIGTTITPWGQFYIQSSVRDKGIRAEEYATRA